jgi:hypothetical protein
VSLAKEAALELRDGDIVLVPMKVHRTNNHYDTGIGVKVVVNNLDFEDRHRSEKDRRPQVTLYSRIIHSVHRKEVRLGDWVQYVDVTGKVIHIDGNEVTIRRRGEWAHTRNHVMAIDMIERIPAPADLTAEERAIFNPRA